MTLEPTDWFLYAVACFFGGFVIQVVYLLHPKQKAIDRLHRYPLDSPDTVLEEGDQEDQ